LKFPLAYQDSFSTESNIAADLSDFGVPISISRNRERSYQVDGWGSLSTPIGEFPEVLRSRSVVENSDNIVTDTATIPINTTTIIYEWYDKEFGFPVLRATGNVIGGETVITGVQYLDIERCLLPAALFGFNPLLPEWDSVSMNATVNFINLSTNADSVRWDFGDGNTSGISDPSHNYSCPGLYDVQLITFNTSCSPSVSDTISIPVLVQGPDGACDPTSNINEQLEVASLRLFPNPSQSSVDVTWEDPSSFSLLRIFDMAGREVESHNLSNRQAFRWDGLVPTGTYTFVFFDWAGRYLVRQVLKE
ncbi:MAG: PKD domain-containing protein, partial [Bacteroidota bacterium]